MKKEIHKNINSKTDRWARNKRKYGTYDGKIDTLEETESLSQGQAHHLYTYCLEESHPHINCG